MSDLSFMTTIGTCSAIKTLPRIKFISLTSHSLTSNQDPRDGETMKVTVTCDVKAGDELTILYMDSSVLSMAGEKRRCELLIRREFLCEV